jgi:hypothetical protein
MAAHDDLGAHSLSPHHGRVDVIDLKPQQQPVPRGHVLPIAYAPVVMLDVPRNAA